MNKTKLLIVIVIILSTLIVSYAIPKPRYIGTGFISSLKIPNSAGEWHGKDVSSALDLDFDKDWNKFISEVLIYQYANQEGDKLNFIILDAGNFHNPKVCFTAAGFDINEVDETEFKISDGSIKAHTLLTKKEHESNVSFYWIIIDKKIVHSWIEQKMKQLYFSLFNRERVGLMVRIDIPSDKKDINAARVTAQKFITELSQEIPSGKVEYLFGENRSEG